MDKVVHFEIPFDDKGRAMNFYAENFGWKLHDMGTEAGDYVLAQTAQTNTNHMVEEKGAINGALYSKATGTMTGQMIVIQVDLIEDTIKKIEATGGKLVTAAVPIPNGRYARISDSEGNIIGIVDYPKK